MKHQTLIAAAAVAVAGLALGGCAKDTSSTSSTPEAVSAPATKPSAAAPAPMPAKEMTHVIMKDCPYYASPATGAAAAGQFKGGTKVLLLMPGYPYCQVEMADGKTAYVMTEMVEPATPPAPQSAKPVASAPPAPQTAKPAPPAETPPAVVEIPVPAVEVPAVTAPAAQTAKPVAPATAPAAAAAPTTPPAKEMTHVLTKEQPYFAAMPLAPDAKPAGTLPAGSKVLLMIPGASYCQVETPEGTTVFTMTDGVESIAKK